MLKKKETNTLDRTELSASLGAKGANNAQKRCCEINQNII